MLCALTVRRLRPGSWEAFRAAWEPDPWPRGLTRAFHVRNLEHPDEVTSFGFFDMTEDEFDRMRDDPEFLRGEAARLERIAPFQEDVLVNGLFEVVEEVMPPPR